ncbi:ECF subfamily RNA polymerase sigma-24 subunit [Galbibacter marinus]|uniref:ECF subfamily RNA polymerase sigma-24 subunit n=1 Tax=Galbibacter marinus TaxID=555500 RepID=K2Q4X9_9FLAO|nr:sigma-70 family RNA polymerase sigma factor [Galbibacter marinus]EKF55891.1 ECF subfamily RNA polymerase sigma-24 subunit [Galbibacter marinus]
MSEKLNNNQVQIENAKKGDQKAFSYLLNTYWNDVYSFQLLRTRDENEAEDITIRTFSKAFDKIKTYKEQYEFKTWLITISKNIHIDLIRQKKPEFARTLSKQDKNSVYNLVDDSPTAEDKLITEQNLASLLQDLKKLKPHYQKVLHLRYFQELSYEEIAKELNEPLNNVKVKLLRAKRLLAEIIHQPKNKNF